MEAFLLQNEIKVKSWPSVSLRPANLIHTAISCRLASIYIIQFHRSLQKVIKHFSFSCQTKSSW